MKEKILLQRQNYLPMFWRPQDIFNDHENWGIGLYKEAKKSKVLLEIWEEIIIPWSLGYP